ncbi:hypothetical protein Bbelb_393800 [Branchiostoma belcheri]|nr:hypothetical protein Bbelb_393800 [Branchiostoma belcheri]
MKKTYTAPILPALTCIYPVDGQVQNSADVVNKIKDSHVEDDETITSYDVCSLFTSIPPKEAVSVVREALEADNTLADRTNLSVDQVINWFRYVDDTWCRLKKRVAADLFDYINQIDDKIKFTQEPSHENMLPFIDIKTIVEEDGDLRFEVYRKPTHTDQYLAFDSYHPLEHKLAVIKTLFRRADIIITSDQAKTDEHRHLRGALARCGYQNWTFNKVLNPSDQSKETHKCKPLTNKTRLTSLFRMSNEYLRNSDGSSKTSIDTNFKPHSTIRQRLVHPKDRPHKEKGGYGSISPALGIWRSQPRGQTTLKLLFCITGAC